MESPSPLCHPDRSVAEWRDLRFALGFREKSLGSSFLEDDRTSSDDPLCLLHGDGLVGR
jgi:hypothetical protein